MRRRLILTVAAAVSMVLLAMLVPLLVLVRSYALEERVSRAALEVQATETVVSNGGDRGGVSVYLDRINRAGDGTQTSVVYPDGTVIGPVDIEDSSTLDQRVVEARLTGLARIDDAEGGVRLLVPVSLGGQGTAADRSPVIVVQVDPPGLGTGLFGTWLLLVAIGLALLIGALVLADRLSRTFVTPIKQLAEHARSLGDARGTTTPVEPVGPPEVRDLAVALNRLVARVEELLEEERRNVSDLSHRLRTPVTALRLRIEALPPGADRVRLDQDLDALEATVDQIVREARRGEREGLVPGTDGVAALVDRVRFWEPLAEDQSRAFTLTVEAADGTPVLASAEDLTALVDVLLDNVFTHTPDGAAVAVRIAERPEGGLELVVDDDGPGFPADLDATSRGASGGGSTGLGLSIAAQTATRSGGGLSLESSRSGGGRVRILLGPPA